MKTKIILGITIALTTAIYFGCKKDAKNQTGNSVVAANTENLSAQMRVAVTGITYTNGMLNFPDQNSFNNTYAALMNEVQTIPSNVTNAEGFDLGHQSQIDFETSFVGFTSIRKRFNTSEIVQAKTGLSPEYIHKPIQFDDILNTLLNDKYQVRIGSNIYYRKNRVVEFMIANNDIVALNAMVNNQNPLNYPNVQVINTEFRGCDFASNYIVKLGTSPANPTLSSNTISTQQTSAAAVPANTCSTNQDIVAGFTKTVDATNNKKVNFTYNGSRDPNIYIKYTYGDGSSSNVMQALPTANLAVSRIYTSNANYNVKLELWNTSTNVYKVNNQMVATGACVININASQTSTNGLTYSFQATISNAIGGANGTYFWNFGDGNSYTGGANISKTYTCSGSKTVTVSYLSSNCGTVTQSITINVGTNSAACKLDKDVKEFDELINGGNNKLQIDIEHGVGTNLFNGNKHTYADVYYDYWKYNAATGFWFKKFADLEIRRYGDLYKKDANGNCDCSVPVSIYLKTLCFFCKNLNIKTDIPDGGNGNYAKIDPLRPPYAEFYVNGQLIVTLIY